MKDAAIIIAAIKKYIDGHVNKSIERRNFRRHTQQPGECFDDFLLTLRDLIKTCNFCSNECMQKNIQDQIIEGILEGDIIEGLLQVKDLNLDKTIQICWPLRNSVLTCLVYIRSWLQLYVPHSHTVKSPLSHSSTHSSTNVPRLWWQNALGGKARCPVFNLPCNSHVTVVANWATLQRCAVADTCDQKPARLHLQHLQMSCQLVKIYLSPV